MTKALAAKKLDKLAKKIAKRAPKSARKYTSEQIIHRMRYGSTGR